MPPDSLTPDALFGLTGPLTLMGWAALLAFPLAPRTATAIAVAIPALLSTLYTALILSFWTGAQGGFGSLADVMVLFDQPEIALAGWVHYLAFDMLVGLWIVRTARAEGLHHLLILPCLPLTFLFGPAGFLAFLILRVALPQRRTA